MEPPPLPNHLRQITLNSVREPVLSRCVSCHVSSVRSSCASFVCIHGYVRDLYGKFRKDMVSGVFSFVVLAGWTNIAPAPPADTFARHLEPLELHHHQ